MPERRAIPAIAMNKQTLTRFAVTVAAGVASYLIIDYLKGRKNAD